MKLPSLGRARPAALLAEHLERKQAEEASSATTAAQARNNFSQNPDLRIAFYLNVLFNYILVDLHVLYFYSVQYSSYITVQS